MSRGVAIFARLAALALLLGFLLRPWVFAPLLQPLNRDGAPAIYTQDSLLWLTFSHLAIVAASSFAATIFAVGFAVLATRPVGEAFLPLSRVIANLGQAFPPVAVLAFAVPVVGFGAMPTLMALFLYGLLPIFENTLTGLTTLPISVIDAANGMGMNEVQRLWRVELPLALPLIIGGIRLSVVIGIATATIGSTVAAHTLGEVIIAGLLTDNLAFIVQGGVVVSVLAVLTFDMFSVLGQRAGRFNQNVHGHAE
jgi:osmoprotectant transport system permease protein